MKNNKTNTYLDKEPADSKNLGRPSVISKNSEEASNTTSCIFPCSCHPNFTKIFSQKLSLPPLIIRLSVLVVLGLQVTASPEFWPALFITKWFSDFFHSEVTCKQKPLFGGKFILHLNSSLVIYWPIGAVWYFYSIIFLRSCSNYMRTVKFSLPRSMLLRLSSFSFLIFKNFK